MQTIQNHPVTLSGLLYAVVVAAFGVNALMGWYPLTEEQTGAWLVFISALIALGTYIVRKYVTPLSNPTDVTGMPLSGPDGEPTQAQTRAGRVSGKGGY